MQFLIEMSHLTELKTQITTFEARGHASLIIMTTFYIWPPLQGGTVGVKGGLLGHKLEFLNNLNGCTWKNHNTNLKRIVMNRNIR